MQVETHSRAFLGLDRRNVPPPLQPMAVTQILTGDMCNQAQKRDSKDKQTFLLQTSNQFFEHSGETTKQTKLLLLPWAANTTVQDTSAVQRVRTTSTLQSKNQTHLAKRTNKTASTRSCLPCLTTSANKHKNVTAGTTERSCFKQASNFSSNRLNKTHRNKIHSAKQKNKTPSAPPCVPC